MAYTDLTSWDKKYLQLAEFIAVEWSKDPSTRVGAVIYGPDGQPVSFGYNGFPQGVADTEERLTDRPTRLLFTQHAEDNALTFARRDVRGCHIVTWPFPPCARCAGKIIQSGIKRIVAPAPSPELQERWGDDLTAATTMYREAGVRLILVGA